MLRPANDEDSTNVLRWRNHPDVRAVSLNQQVIGDAEHAAYWAATREREDREIYIYERHGIASGVVTFFDIDRPAKKASWGYYLDNDGLTERSELLPAWIEIQRQGKKYAFEELGLDTLEGEVLEANEAVRRFNKRNGFHEYERYERDIDGTPTAVLRIRAEKNI